MAQKNTRSFQPRILWVDDDPLYLRYHADLLRDFSGWNIVEENTPGNALSLIQSAGREFSAIILDVWMADTGPLDSLGARGGYLAGVALARKIREQFPDVPILGLSQADESRDWFESQKGMSFLPKTATVAAIARELKRLLDRGEQHRDFKIFIVHGHDDLLKLELKNYLQNTLRLGVPIILHERPDAGRSIIEKFEAEAGDVDFVFVLLTPDDSVGHTSAPNQGKRRARQNVVFELGYFFGALGRRSGRVLLLYKGPLELPTDISGLIYIDVSGGIEAAGERIRREIYSIRPFPSQEDGCGNGP